MNNTERAAVIGSGPNGLAAALTLARAGIPVTVFEARDTIGGGTRTEEIVQEGILHDVCSAIHPMALASPFFQEFELAKRIDFVTPDVSYAHPLDGSASPDGTAALAYRDLDRVAEELGTDGRAYRNLYRPLVDHLEGIVDIALGGSTFHIPRQLGSLSGIRELITFGLRVAEQGTPLWNARFTGQHAPALITGAAAHSIGRMPRPSTTAVGLVLGSLAHASGWPVPIGGSQSIAQAMADDLLAHGGEIRTGTPITHMGQLDGFSTLIFDTSARALADIAGDRLPDSYAKRLRSLTYGDGVAKVDFVLDGPIPWRDSRVSEAPTVHVGGSRAEMRRSEYHVSRGRHPRSPYVIVAQSDAFDTARNPDGKHAIWSYTHVPHGSTLDMVDAVTAQIERFAPGFRDRIVAVNSVTAQELSRYNANYIGGDISAGAVSLKQLLARPTIGADPWRTPAPGIYLASSSAPPGPGVHGLCGWYAAKSALKHEYGLGAPDLGYQQS